MSRRYAHKSSGAVERRSGGKSDSSSRIQTGDSEAAKTGEDDETEALLSTQAPYLKTRTASVEKPIAA